MRVNQAVDSMAQADAAGAGRAQDARVGRGEARRFGERLFRPRPRGATFDEAASAPSLPEGGPLGLRASCRATSAAPSGATPGADRVLASELVDRIAVGRTRFGLPEVRMTIAAPGLAGTEVRLCGSPHGVEATFLAATESARRAIEARLTELARALEGRGIRVARCEIESRPRSREGRRQDRAP